jgi:sigma-E factor negative regulatory protein RseA
MSREMSSQEVINEMSPAEQDLAQRISALVDGEHDEAGYASTVARDAQAAARWARYQSIGDMLRSAELAPTARDETFMTRMRLSLAAEPVVVAPAAHAAIEAKTGAKMPPQAQPQHAHANANANAGSTGLSAVAGRTTAILAGLAAAAIAALSWSSFGSKPQTPAVELSQSATAPAVAVKVATPAEPAAASLVVVQTANGAVIRDARLDQYFAAHSGMRSGTGLGNGASMAAPAAFVRSASIDSAAQQ